VGVALAQGLADFAKLRLRGDRETAMRDFVKAALIRRLLTGKRLGQLQNAAVKVRLWQKMNPPVLQALREHSSHGDRIVIASGGLSLYLPEMLRDIPYDALICTDIGVENNLVTGKMINGNCVRQGKAERVAAWLAQNGPFDESWAYGNYPHDVPMMNLVKHRIIVS
jgi:HAD superfamily phosphoserine phosphatase-like hydrolase